MEDYSLYMLDMKNDIGNLEEGLTLTMLVFESMNGKLEDLNNHLESIALSLERRE